MMLGRNSAAGMIEWTEPIWRARSTLCTASNSAATSPSLSERTAVRVAPSFTRRPALAAGTGDAGSAGLRGKVGATPAGGRSDKLGEGGAEVEAGHKAGRGRPGGSRSGEGGG